MNLSVFHCSSQIHRSVNPLPESGIAQSTIRSSQENGIVLSKMDEKDCRSRLLDCDKLDNASFTRSCFLFSE